MSHNQWDGKTERRINYTDHDTLIQVVQLLKHQSENARIIAENLDKHETKDQSNFDLIRKDILNLQKIVWTVTGIILTLDALPKIGDIFHLIK